MMSETVAVVLGELELATVRAFAKDMGYPSTSSALRRIINEWVIFKGAQYRLALDGACDEENGDMTTISQGELAAIN